MTQPTPKATMAKKKKRVAARSPRIKTTSRLKSMSAGPAPHVPVPTPSDAPNGYAYWHPPMSGGPPPDPLPPLLRPHYPIALGNPLLPVV